MNSSDYLKTILDRENVAPGMDKLLRQILESPGYMLSTERPAQSPQRVMVIATAFGGNPEAALRVGTAIGCVAAATDLLDDWHDGDELPAPAPQALLASFALGQLAHLCLADLADYVSGEQARLISTMLARYVFHMCAGQEMDLAFEQLPMVDREDARLAGWLKGGAFYRMTFELGAALGTMDEMTLELAGEIGQHIGTAVQERNNLAGLPQDVRRYKKTVPLVLTLEERPDHPAMIAWSQRTRPMDDTLVQEVVHVVETSLAYATTVALSEAHLDSAQFGLDKLGPIGKQLECLMPAELIPPELLPPEE